MNAGEAQERPVLRSHPQSQPEDAPRVGSRGRLRVPPPQPNALEAAKAKPADALGRDNTRGNIHSVRCV